MRFRADYAAYTLLFKSKAVTSRDVLTRRDTYYIRISDNHSGETGIGECALFRGLGDDDREDYEDCLRDACRKINFASSLDEISATPYTSLRFGLETAVNDLRNGGCRRPFPSPWSDGKGEIAINGLVWMGNAQQMLRRIDEKLEKGFRCVKLKIGGIDFDEELKLLAYIRNRFPSSRLELRLDANGAFNPNDALVKLEKLAGYSIHSIEQPVKPGQWREMAEICRLSPIPVALDEELIGCNDDAFMERLLDEVKPAYLILKPSLCGGFYGAERWIHYAESKGVGWWATSALESNVGLNAIAQWISCRPTTMPQGLGTGGLYVNNVESPIVQERDVLRYNPETKWKFPDLEWIAV